MRGGSCRTSALARSPVRFQDDHDIASLLDIATAEDLETARQSVRLITARSMSRDKSLEADLEAAIARSRAGPLP
jgi:hypothetical protein